MYKFVKAICLPKTVGARWSEVDISQMLASNVVLNYRKVYLVVLNKVINEEIFVDFEFLTSRFSAPNYTVNDILDRAYGRPLETVESLPTGNITYVKYASGNKAGYVFDFVKAGYNLSHNNSSEYLTDLKVTRPNYETDVSMLHTHSLLTVNGFIHNTDTDGTNSFIIDGAKTMKISGDPRFGILSFLDVGRLTKLKLNDESIFEFEEGAGLSKKIVINIPEELGNRTFFLVLGGYAIFPENGIFWQVGESSFILDMEKIPYLERIFESREFIDLGPLELDIPAINKDAVDVSQVYSDEVIRKYFKLSQTFFTIVDSEHLGFYKQSIRGINTPGMFILENELNAPMFSQHGRVVEYWSRNTHGKYVISAPDTYFRNYVFNYRRESKKQLISNALSAQNPVYGTGNMVLEISGIKNIL